MTNTNKDSLATRIICAIWKPIDKRAYDKAKAKRDAFTAKHRTPPGM